MKKSLYFMLAAACAVAACTKVQEIENLEKDGSVCGPDITAYQESGTKTLLDVVDGVGTIYWKPADNINVFYGTCNMQHASHLFFAMLIPPFLFV